MANIRKKPFQLWREIWNQMLVTLLQLYVLESEQKQKGNATKWAGPGIAQKRSYSVV